MEIPPGHTLEILPELVESFTENPVAGLSLRSTFCAGGGRLGGFVAGADVGGGGFYGTLFGVQIIFLGRLTGGVATLTPGYIM
jgi:hypothetical protein